MSRDVFVIGAGAHVPYGFPTGQKLKEIIRSISYSCNDSDTNASGNVVRSFLLKYMEDNPQETMDRYQKYWSRSGGGTFRGICERIVKDFVTDFVDAGTFTIDAFLATRTDWSDLGKLVIAVIIRKYERRDPLRNMTDDWIHQFIAMYLVKKDREHIYANFPNVITFNYDRLLEEAIYRRLTKFFLYEEYEAIEILNKLNIHHVYGKIGDTRFDKLKFETQSDLAAAAKKILIVGEEREESDLKSEIDDLMDSSSSVYVLGFGYDLINADLVFGRKKFKVARSTNIGLHVRKIDHYDKQSSSPSFFVNHDGVEVDCTELFRRFL